MKSKSFFIFICCIIGMAIFLLGYVSGIDGFIIISGILLFIAIIIRLIL